MVYDVFLFIIYSVEAPFLFLGEGCCYGRRMITNQRGQSYVASKGRKDQRSKPD
jgi:hypothetical protein